MKGHLLLNKMQSEISNPLSVVNGCLYFWQVLYRYCDKSFINKHAFLNFVPILIKKNYRTGIWFYRFMSASAGTHFFMTILPNFIKCGKNNCRFTKNMVSIGI